MNRAIALLSGEATGIPLAEAKSLFLTYDPGARFDMPQDRVLLSETTADPFVVSERVAFARRVGFLLNSPEEAFPRMRGRRIRLREYVIPGGVPSSAPPGDLLRGCDATIDLVNPDLELTVIRGEREYFALADPLRMVQGWSKRRPRKRQFFHPSAIFPKFARALVNLSRCKKGGVFLDPFSGTGSLPLEALFVGADVVAMDQTRKMAAGSLLNMRHYGETLLGVIRGDAFSPPFRSVDAIATDVPYGRVSSTRGEEPAAVLLGALHSLSNVASPGSFVVVMHRKQDEVLPPSGLSVESAHDLYVHKRLTRTVSVFRKR